jgi:beta-galactosidase
MHGRNLALAAALFASSAAAVAAPAPPAPRTVQQFTEGWRFINGDPAGAQQLAFDDAAWKTVTLPHDWAIAGPVDQNAPTRGAGGFFPAGIGWYRKAFTVAASDAISTASRRTFIVFDGVMANSDVYLNGELLGHRPYGYVSFVYELTPHLRPGRNIIAVRADNSQQPASRWYPGAGINRQVRLVTTGDTHIVPWGTFVTTPSVSEQSATVHIRSSAINESTAAATVSLHVRILGPNGAAVLRPVSSATPLSLAPGATGDLEADATVPTPDRWDLNHGALYKMQATLLRNGKPVDTETVPFGIREFHFDADQGFFLNGVHHKIYGAAVHTDGGAVGTAVPLGVWERRLAELRKLGVNAIRTAHNPPAPEFLDLADRMGFLVMDEMFDCWTVAKNPYDYHLYFKEWSLRDTADTVMRDRNHPSIILWSAGNEIHDTPKPEIAIPILKSLVDTFHKYDPTRPVTQALFRPNVSHDYDNGLADLLDVVGQNYREQEILAAHAQKPTRKIIGTENTHDRNQWVAMRDHPEYSGQFLWSGIDYLGEAGRWPSIGSGSGLLLSNALTRPRALERQSWWSSTPMVAVVRRVTAQRAAPVDPGYANPTTVDQSAAPATRSAAAGAQPPLDPSVRFSQPLLADWTPKNLEPHTESVEVYTNAHEVELFLNGKSLGTQELHADASPITYQVPFTPGELKAVARSGGKDVATDILKTAGKPARVVLSADSPTRPLTPDWNDVRYVTATLVDDVGTRIPDSTTLMHFSATGPASVIGVDNGNMIDHDSFQGSERRVYDGNVCALVRATGSVGRVTVTATAEGLPPATINLQTAPLAREDRMIASPAENERGF